MHGNPAIGTKFLGDELRRQLGRQETDVEDGLAGVVVVGVQLQVLQQGVGKCLDDVGTVESVVTLVRRGRDRYGTYCSAKKVKQTQAQMR